MNTCHARARRLADPAPVAQTFFVDVGVKRFACLDAIITVVDGKHALEHLNEVKAEGVENESVEQVAFADVIVLNKCDLVDEATLSSVVARIRSINGSAKVIRAVNATVSVDDVVGVHAFDLERILSFDSTFLEDSDHMHDTTVTSVGISVPGELDGDKFNDWLGKLLRERGTDIFRCKGVLAIKGMPEKVVFQGVHMLMSCVPLAPWGVDEERLSRAIFIGRKLDRAELTAGLTRCQVASASSSIALRTRAAHRAEAAASGDEAAASSSAVAAGGGTPMEVDEST